jgi:hypothetical protein
MILDGLEGDPSAGCDAAAGCFLCCGPWKNQLVNWQDLQFCGIIHVTN